MKKVVRTAIIVVVVGVVATGAYLKFRPQKASAQTSVSTATASLGSLAATVNAAGNITSHRTADLSFGQSGTVRKINVKVGDRVNAGDVLGELDMTDLNLQLRSAQVNLKNAQNSLAKTKDPNTADEIASARAQLEAAQASYDKVAAGPTDSEVATAQAQLASAQASYNAAVKSAGTTGSSLLSAAASLEKARIALEKAQGAYDRVAWRGDAGSTSEASALQSATIDYASAKASYESAAATADTDSASKLASAKASLQSAQSNLATAKEPASAAELASARASVIQAQNDLDSLLAGPDASELDTAQNGVESAQIALDQMKLKLAQAQVVAPFEGIVTAVNAKLGQSVSGTAFSIADLDHLDIVVNMSEVDVDKIKAGQQAEITLDAVADATFEGSVSLVAPAGTQSSGVVNYPVTIAVTKTTDAVKTGMTANVNIVVDERNNVLLVPNRAVKTVNKQKLVTVLFEGQQFQTPVETGLSSDSMTEIVSGLREGDTVVINSTTTATQSNSGGAMPGGGMGFPGAGGPPPGM